MSTGSDVADQFVAATAARLPEGAGESAYRAAEHRGGTIDGDEWKMSQLVAERAALRWVRKVLAISGQDVEAQALENLGVAQATYIAKLIEDDYADPLEEGSEAETCCSEAVAALDSAVGLLGITDRDQLREPARHAGHALSACFLAGAVNSIPDEVGDTLDLMASDPLPNSLIAWE
jgi:hypothetical protein